MEWPARQLALLAVIFQLQGPGGVNEPPLEATRAGLRDLQGVISAQGCTTLAAPASRPSLPHLSAILPPAPPMGTGMLLGWHAGCSGNSLRLPTPSLTGVSVKTVSAAQLVPAHLEVPSH